eukprot:GEMP01007761.1.p1 GENE.GEMP01007761.1~~GEMP01007761.1.p1  ORF type:complete len:827 (+),score=138.18 GEMP01007761.1:133-2613(+)
MNFNLHLPWTQPENPSIGRTSASRMSPTSPDGGWMTESTNPFANHLRQVPQLFSDLHRTSATNASPTAFSLRTSESSAHRVSGAERVSQGASNMAGLRSPSLSGNMAGAPLRTSALQAPMLANFGPQFAGTPNPKYDMELAFTALESCDESNVNRQAELCSRMHGFLLGADPEHPRLSRVSQTDVVDGTFDDFDPGMLEFMRESFTHALEMPKRSDGWAARHLLNVVEFCQHHGGDIPIHPIFVLRVLRDVAVLMSADAQNPVREMQVPQNGQFVVVGDTHGQLEDALWIFHKNGLPSATNAYLFNGDIADRGRNALEIFIILYVAMLVYPNQVGINRGNHEDETVNMDSHCGGFYEEIMDKYGSVIGGRLWIEVIKLYPLLPLATVLSNRVFIVHGGLSRQEHMLPLLKSITTRKVTLPEMPHAPMDVVCVDAMWSDPQDGPGIIASSRGQSLIQFGPDVTHKFLYENGFQLLVRSHQPPKNKDGAFFHHDNRLVTVFSASNYCGWYGNQGGVLIFQPNLQYQVDRHFSPTFETLRQVKFVSDDTERFSPKRRQTNTALEIQAHRHSTTRDPMKTLLRQDIRQRLARLIVENKQTLWTYFFDADNAPPHGFITVHAFRTVMTAVLGHTGAPWGEIGNIGELDSASGQVDYHGFLHRFQCVLKTDRDSGVITNWMETVLGRLYGRLMRADLGWADLCRRFDSTGTGKVSPSDFRREVQCGKDGGRPMTQGGLSEEQTTQLLRTLAAHSCTRVGAPGITDVDVSELLSRLEISRTYRCSIGKPKPTEALCGCGHRLKWEAGPGRIRMCYRRYNVHASGNSCRYTTVR